MRKNPCYKLEQKLCGHEIGWRDRGKGERMALREREKIASKKMKIEKVDREGRMKEHFKREHMRASKSNRESAS